MSDADDRLLLCQQILGELGTRSTITSLDPPDGSPEAYYCSLLFNNTRDTLLRAAHWNCAGQSAPGIMWKALTGTPENPVVPDRYTWSFRDPSPPWLYSYVRPYAGIQIRRLRDQSLFGSDVPTSIPFYGGSMINLTSHAELSCLPFETATDKYDRNGTLLSPNVHSISSVAVVTNGNNYRSGDFITLTQPGALFGQPAILEVSEIDRATGVFFTVIAEGGTWTDWSDTVPLEQASTTGSGSGFTCSAIFTVHPGRMSVILTNARNPIIDYTTSEIGVADWDPGFQNAFMSALEGKLALSLLGDKAMAKLKLEQANGEILEARVRDGNEGLTTYDHVPDWLSVRGVASMGSPWVNPPYYGPLFAV
jgi:hypothetical protein